MAPVLVPPVHVPPRLASPGRPGPAVPPVRARGGGPLHAFRILCPPAHAALLEGTGEGSASWLRDESGCSDVTLSSEADCFPNTPLRFLGICGHPQEMAKALELVLAQVVECGQEEERKGHRHSAHGFRGKEPDEVVFRFCLPDTTSKALIGPHGSVIQQLRKDTGSKIFVDNESREDQNLVRVIGVRRAVFDGLMRINDIIYREAETESFQRWTQTVRGVALRMAPGPGAPTTPEWPPKGRASPARSTHVPPVDHPRPMLRPKVRVAASAASGAMADPAVIDAHVDRLADHLGQLPKGAVKLRYSIACEVPLDFMGALAGPLAEFLSGVRETTQTTIDLGPDTDPGDPEAATTVSIDGPLLNVYEAHLLIMARVREEEQRAGEEEERRIREEEQRAREEEERRVREEEEERERKRRRVEEELRRAREAEEAAQRQAETEKLRRRLEEERRRELEQFEERKRLEAFDADLRRQREEIEAEERRAAAAVQKRLLVPRQPAEPPPAEVLLDAEDEDGPELTEEEILAQLAKLKALLARAQARRAKAAAVAAVAARQSGPG